MTIKLMKKVRRIFLATTTTTNLMPPGPQSPSRGSASLRQANSLRYQYRRDISSDNSFDRVFNRVNDTNPSTSDDTVNMSSSSYTSQVDKDLNAAAVTASAQGKSKNTQDAPQKGTPSTDEVTELEDTEETTDPKKLTVMDLFSIGSLNFEEINVDEDISNADPNLMSMLPQSKASIDKNQDMLNLLAGRTWKINSQSLDGNQAEGSITASDENALSLQSLSQLTSDSYFMLQRLFGNSLLANQNMSSTNVDANLTTSTGESVDLTSAIELLNSLSGGNADLEGIVESLQNLTGNSANQWNGLPIIESNILTDSQQNPQMTLPNQPVQVPEQENTLAPNLTQDGEGQEQNPQLTQQLQPQTTTTDDSTEQGGAGQITNTTVYSQTSSSTDPSSSQTNAQNPQLTETSTSVPTTDADQPVPQEQLKNITYQPQQAQTQSSGQIETVALPQVQTTLADNQVNRQQPVQSTMANLNAVPTDDVQNVQPSPQTSQQQFQNQQQNSQSQQTVSETDPEATVTSNTQPSPTENFASHLGAVLNHNTNDPLNVPSESLDQTSQTARQEANLTAQIVEHARMIRNAENTEMVIHLKPEHLGELTLRVSATTNGSVNVTFHSENVQVRAMLENTLAQLKQELSNQGLKVENVQVSAHLSDGGMMNGKGQQAWEQSQQGSNNARVGRIGRVNGSGGGLNTLEEAEIVSTSIPENAAVDGGVDYRV